MISTILQINVECEPDVLNKFMLYYPDKEAFADEIIRQITESRCLFTGKPLTLKYRKYKGEEDA